MDRTILMVEDEENIRKLVENELKRKGYIVIAAENGVKGLEHLQSFKPDLILLDINMPEMNGIQFFKNILDDQSNPKFPVLFFSTRSEFADMFTGEMDAVGFIEKPFKMGELIEKIEKFFETQN